MSPTDSLAQPARRASMLGLLAVSAIVGQVSLAVSAWLLPVWSEFGLVGDNISELVLGRYGFVQTSAFVLAGVGTIGLALAIRKLTLGSWGSLVGSLLVAIYGAGAILSAIFPTDRIDSSADVSSLSATGGIHVLVFMVSFLSIVVGMFVLTRMFARDDKWRSFSRWAILLPAGALAISLFQSEGPLVGLMQRFLIAMPSAWLILVALKVHKILTTVDTDAEVGYAAPAPTATQQVVES